MISATQPASPPATNDPKPIPQDSPQFPIPSDALSPLDPNLTDRQHAALDLIAAGLTLSNVAVQLRIDRKTLYNWRKTNPQFRAALESRRRELTDAASERFSELLDRALDILEKQLNNNYAPTAHRAARTLLVLARLGSLPPTTNDK